MLKIFVFRCRSAGVSAARAPFTAASERFSQRIGSALEVTVVPIPSVRSGDILGPIAFSIRKFARTMCIYTSLVERTPVAGRHANFSGGVARLTARTRDSIRPRIPETHQAPLERTTSKCSLITTATRLLPTLFSQGSSSHAIKMHLNRFRRLSAANVTNNSSYSARKPSIPIQSCARSCRFFL